MFGRVADQVGDSYSHHSGHNLEPQRQADQSQFWIVVLVVGRSLIQNDFEESYTHDGHGYGGGCLGLVLGLVDHGLSVHYLEGELHSRNR